MEILKPLIIKKRNLFSFNPKYFISLFFVGKQVKSSKQVKYLELNVSYSNQ